jgi:integrase
VAVDADPPRPEPGRKLRTWNADQLRRFLDSIRDPRLYPLYHLLAQTGARRGEALGARWEDFDGARWTVCRNLVPTTGGAIESTPKTATGRRNVALDATTVRVLREWRKHQLEERLAWGPAWQDTGRVFTREDGTDLSPNGVSQTFAALVRACEGLPGIRLHDLRHTHATLALQAGVHVKVVAERLGHSSVKVTLDIYSHAIPAMQEDAAAKVAQLIEP